MPSFCTTAFKVKANDVKMANAANLSFEQQNPKIKGDPQQNNLDNYMLTLYIAQFF